MTSAETVFNKNGFPTLTRGALTTLQVNLGYRCNLKCEHCHVNASPERKEEMDAATAQTVIDFMDRHPLTTLDLTGGAPELNVHFRALVVAARSRGIHVIDRCNLTILTEPGQEGTAAFLAENRVEVIASLPCYLRENVDQQRGAGSYEASVAGLKKLNDLGYGQEGSGLLLNLVFNPLGPTLPPAQMGLEAAYKERLARIGIVFNTLFTMTNMPIKRFSALLSSQGKLDAYQQLLKENFAPGNMEGLMCRFQVSVDWRGRLFDCDFNQALNMPLRSPSGAPLTLEGLDPETLTDALVLTADHCHGCAAGQGSSCGGAIS